MSFSTLAITHSFKNADGTAASGSVKATLSKMMTNGSTSIVPASVTSNLDASGNLAISLTSNLDTGTFPTDAQWRLDLDILGAENAEYFVVVPTGGGTADLATLLPQSQQVG